MKKIIKVTICGAAVIISALIGLAVFIRIRNDKVINEIFEDVKDV